MLNPVTIKDQAYLCPTWSDMGELTVILGNQIKASKNHYDRIIALAKGGWGWARQLQDLLGIKDLASIQISFYKSIGKTNKSPVVIQSLPISVAGESILVYDDVVDSGETIALAKDYLKIHGAKLVHTASHYTKSWTKVQPDFSAASTDTWIIFPHDATESIKILRNKLSIDQINQLGIEPAIINSALKD